MNTEHLDNMMIFGGAEGVRYAERIFGEIIEKYELDKINDNLKLE